MNNHSHLPASVADWRIRLVLVILGLGLWFSTQSLISRREMPDTASDIKAASRVLLHGDRLLDLTATANDYLRSQPQMADGLLIVSSLVIDLLGIGLLAWSIFGLSIRPFLGLLILFFLRQLCQGLCALPAPPGMIWRPPHLPAMLGGGAFPSLLVTYGVANDFFFSGHTAIAVYGAVELARLRLRSLCVLAILIAIFEMVVVVELRAHWTMDVFAGAITALFVAGVAQRWAPAWDRRLAAITHPVKNS